ncbi:MAG: hypothetical protein R3E93_00285 [Thiothrix sp.]
MNQAELAIVSSKGESVVPEAGIAEKAEQAEQRIDAVHVEQQGNSGDSRLAVSFFPQAEVHDKLIQRRVP